MFSKFPRDSRHVRGLLGEDVMIGPEEVNKGAFLFVGECCLDLNMLGRVDVIDLDVLHVFDGFECAKMVLGASGPAMESTPLRNSANSIVAAYADTTRARN